MGEFREIVVCGHVGIRATDTCDHVYTVHCNNPECFFHKDAPPNMVSHII